MVDFNELNRQRARYKAFTETEIGKAFAAYDRAVIAYWREDSNERISDKKLSALSDAERQTRKALLDLLMVDIP